MVRFRAAEVRHFASIDFKLVSTNGLFEVLC